MKMDFLNAIPPYVCERWQEVAGKAPDASFLVEEGVRNQLFPRAGRRIVRPGLQVAFGQGDRRGGFRADPAAQGRPALHRHAGRMEGWRGIHRGGGQLRAGTDRGDPAGLRLPLRNRKERRIPAKRLPYLRKRTKRRVPERPEPGARRMPEEPEQAPWQQERLPWICPPCALSC